ncbi:hypothetical protein [Neomoorella glycerini]|uniref:hypothetical protein n=1 Tax=Neomoorella glycerini TaxID=55779 RepID=UPI0012E2F30C|nr:hypothetical protein [Moorella glycerini]
MKGDGELIKEILERRLYEGVLAESDAGTLVEEGNAGFEALEAIDRNDDVPVAEAAEKQAEENKSSDTSATDKMEAKGEKQITLPELRSRASVTNNKELVTLVVYYGDYYRGQAPNTEEVRRMLREELREKSKTVNAVSTYLQRARKEGWIDQEGKKWRMTSTGIQRVKTWLAE